MTQILPLLAGAALLVTAACGSGEGTREDTGAPVDAVVLRYETSSRTKDHTADVALVVHADGRLFVGFGGEEPDESARQLSKHEVDELERRLVDEGYGDLESPQVDDRTEDGMDRVLIARIGTRTRTLRFEGVSRPLLDDLQQLASSASPR